LYCNPDGNTFTPGLEAFSVRKAVDSGVWAAEEMDTVAKNVYRKRARRRRRRRFVMVGPCGLFGFELSIER